MDEDSTNELRDDVLRCIGPDLTTTPRGLGADLTGRRDWAPALRT